MYMKDFFKIFVYMHGEEIGKLFVTRGFDLSLSRKVGKGEQTHIIYRRNGCAELAEYNVLDGVIGRVFLFRGDEVTCAYALDEIEKWLGVI